MRSEKLAIKKFDGRRRTLEELGGEYCLQDLLISCSNLVPPKGQAWERQEGAGEVDAGEFCWCLQRWRDPQSQL